MWIPIPTIESYVIYAASQVNASEHASSFAKARERLEARMPQANELNKAQGEAFGLVKSFE